MAAQGACRDCAQPPLGGPGENRYTAYDTMCAGTQCVSVNLSNLTLFVRATELPMAGFALERSYNSDDTHVGAFGTGWSSNVLESLTADADGTLVLRRASGRIDRFAVTPSGSVFAVTPTTDTVAKNSDGTYTLRESGSNATRVFSADGRLLTVQDAGVTRVAFDYDGAGRVTAARYRGRKISFSYDGNGRISSAADSAGRTVDYTYSDDGRMTKAGIAAYQYDDAGNLTRVGGVAIAYAGDAGFTQVAAAGAHKYDVPATPSQIRMTDSNGDSSFYVSNAAGLLASVTDGNGNTVTYSYDSAGRRTSVTNASGETAKFTYDAAGNLTGVTDSGGNKWTADYTAGGPAHITDPKGNVWTLKYDAAGKLVSVSDPAGGSLTATRSAAEQITAIADALGNKTGYAYDGDGLLTGYTDALGGQWTYSYDGAARVASRTDPGGGAQQAGGPVIASQICRFLDVGTQCGDNFGNSITTDGEGQVVEFAMPGGKKVSYQYDHAHRLSKVSDWAGNFAVYKYDAAGYPQSVTVSGGPVTIYQYDAAHRLKAVVSTGADGATVAGYRYTLDANGNRTGITALEPGTAPAKIAAYQYGVDAAGRPVSRSDGESYSYDARGNLSAIQGGRNITFKYDDSGRLAGLTGDVIATYTYDDLGPRTGRTVNGTERRFDTWNGRVVMETDGSGAPVAWYVYGLGLLWKVAADGTTYFYHFDGDGNAVAMSSASAGVVNRYRYDSAGRLVSSTEQVDNPFRARGSAGWMDDGDGLTFTGASFLLPDLRLTLPAAAEVSPPDPESKLAPALNGAGQCFLRGVAGCAIGDGRRAQ